MSSKTAESWPQELIDELKSVIEKQEETADYFAQRIGKAVSSLYGMKKKLGIETSFVAKSKAKYKAERLPAGAIVKTDATSEVALFVLETNIPIPGVREPIVSKQKEELLKGIMKKMEVGNSFTVPKNHVKRIRELFVEFHPEYKTKASPVNKEENAHYRFWRTA